MKAIISRGSKQSPNPLKFDLLKNREAMTAILSIDEYRRFLPAILEIDGVEPVELSPMVQDLGDRLKYVLVNSFCLVRSKTIINIYMSVSVYRNRGGFKQYYYLSIKAEKCH